MHAGTEGTVVAAAFFRHLLLGGFLFGGGFLLFLLGFLLLAHGLAAFGQQTYRRANGGALAGIVTGDIPDNRAGSGTGHHLTTT